jgi:hypothetical protein
MIAVAEETGAGLIYSDFKDELNAGLVDHPLIDYQPGSIRDDFEFGPCFLLSRFAIENALKTSGEIRQDLNWGGLYDLRLKISECSAIFHIPESLYIRKPYDIRESGRKVFDYVNPGLVDYQREMESIATDHLKRIGAFLEPQFRSIPKSDDSFPIEASVIIPVRNRARTIKEAAGSALSQETDFKFNVIVIDNHSTDGTTEVLNDLAVSNRNLIHIIPKRIDLGIGGCWNEGIFSPHCGKYAVQLDSDDLYIDHHVLQCIVDTFTGGDYAMVIGSYKLVNFDLQEIPPGIVDHREWTRENGRNNALRINGLGAPRAFYVPVLRQFGFPNSSYGEDYAVGLHISRYYEIGRIYEPLYYARRWEDNSDATLDTATANHFNLYKDRLRTLELLARIRTDARY